MSISWFSLFLHGELDVLWQLVLGHLVHDVQVVPEVGQGVAGVLAQEALLLGIQLGPLHCEEMCPASLQVNDWYRGPP